MLSIYKADIVEINDIFEIYRDLPFWNAFSLSPETIDLNFPRGNYFKINNYLKCCVDGIFDLNDDFDEENRRYPAMNLLETYIDENIFNEKVIVLEDLNDGISEPYENNIFQDVLDDSGNYQFGD